MGKDLKGKELGRGISQRTDGIYVGRYVDKLRKRHSFYDSDIKQLRRKLEKARYESENGVYGTGEAVTLTSFFEEYLKLYKVGKVKDVTLYRIRQTYAPCEKDVLGSMKLKDVRACHIQQFINKMDANGNTYGTIKLVKCLLAEMFRVAIGNGLIIINPCDAVVLPKKVTYERRFLTEKEQEMFLDAAREYGHYDIFCANLSCGMRVGELLGLKWTDVDFEKKTIHIQRTLHYARVSNDEPCHFFFTTPKTVTSERIIPMLPETEAILKRVKKKQLETRMLNAKVWHQEEPFEDMVFTANQGSPVRYGDVNRTIKKAILKANMQEKALAEFENREPYHLKGFSPHCFRHTFVTRCKEKGIPYETIQPYVGHSNKEMTMYYDHNKKELGVADFENVSFFNVV